jgi:hypothetical protein
VPIWLLLYCQTTFYVDCPLSGWEEKHAGTERTNHIVLSLKYINTRQSCTQITNKWQGCPDWIIQLFLTEETKRTNVYDQPDDNLWIKLIELTVRDTNECILVLAEYCKLCHISEIRMKYFTLNYQNIMCISCVISGSCNSKCYDLLALHRGKQCNSHGDSKICIYMAEHRRLRWKHEPLCQLISSLFARFCKYIAAKQIFQLFYKILSPERWRFIA